MDEEQHWRNVEIEWAFVNQKLEPSMNNPPPWTVFVTRSIYPENVMRFEKNGYEVSTFFDGITKLKYIGLSMST